MIEGGDVEHGKPNDKVPGLILIEALEVSMTEMVERVCQRLLEEIKG